MKEGEDLPPFSFSKQYHKSHSISIKVRVKEVMDHWPDEFFYKAGLFKMVCKVA